MTNTHINIYTYTEERRLAGKQEFRGRRGGMRKVNRDEIKTIKLTIYMYEIIKE